MPWSRPVEEVIRARSSCRSFDGRVLQGPDELMAALARRPDAPFGSAIRLELLRDVRDEDQQGGKLGTYGFIRGARSFLVGVVGPGERALEDLGYVFEWAVLTATDQGLGTCWVGGTFRRGAFGAAVGVSSDEVVPVVSPVGHRRARRGLVDSAIRWAAGSRNRKPWDELFFAGSPGAPLTPDAAGELAEPLELLRLAPSAANNQPWRAVVDDGAVHLLLKRTPGYRRLGQVDLQRVDMGIAMCHLELGLRAAGVEGRWRQEPQDHDGLEYVVSWRSA